MLKRTKFRLQELQFDYQGDLISVTCLTGVHPVEKSVLLWDVQYLISMEKCTDSHILLCALAVVMRQFGSKKVCVKSWMLERDAAFSECVSPKKIVSDFYQISL